MIKVLLTIIHMCVCVQQLLPTHIHQSVHCSFFLSRIVGTCDPHLDFRKQNPMILSPGSRFGFRCSSCTAAGERSTEGRTRFLDMDSHFPRWHPAWWSCGPPTARSGPHDTSHRLVRFSRRFMKLSLDIAPLPSVWS